MRTMYSSIAALALMVPSLAFSMADEGNAGGGAPSNETGGAGQAPVTETKTILKQNGIKRPDTGSVTGRLWDIADEESAKLGQPAPRKAVVDRYMAEQPAANVATANTQYARWVTYHGASDVLRQNRDAAKAEKSKAGEAAKAAKEAEKAAAKEAKEKEKADKAAKKAADKKAKEDEKARLAAEKKAAEDKAAAEKKAAEDAAGKNGNSPKK